MNRIVIACAATALVAVTTFTTSAYALDRKVKIINETTFDIMRFYGSHVGADSWQEDILGAEINFESPIDEDLMDRFVSNQFSVAAMVDGQADSQFKAQANGIPTDGGATSVLTLDAITSGVFARAKARSTGRRRPSCN